MFETVTVSVIELPGVSTGRKYDRLRRSLGSGLAGPTLNVGPGFDPAPAAGQARLDVSADERST